MRDDALTTGFQILLVLALMLVMWRELEKICFLIDEGERRDEAHARAEADAEARAEQEGPDVEGERGWISQLIGPNR